MALDTDAHHSTLTGLNKFLPMILIDNILVDEDIFSIKFACDLDKCKGACCTLQGGLGAPVTDAEVPLIEDSMRAASQYLSEHSKRILAERGPVEGGTGNHNTVCIDSRDCVFVFYESGVAKCSLEKAYIEGKTEFRKPLSCHLFPIRETNFGGNYIFYQTFEECGPALDLGKKTGLPMYVLVKDALIRAYGEVWYAKLVEYARTHEMVKIK